MSAKNTGAGDFTAENPAVIVDDLTGVLDDADLVEGSLTATVDGVEVAAPTLDGNRLNWSGPLAAGDEVVISYKVKLKAGGDRNVKNVAFQGDPENPEKPTPACDAESPEVVDCEEFDLPALTIAKTSDAAADAKPGDTVTYTVTATNAGPGAFTADSPAVVTDDMSDVIDDAAYGADATATVNGAPAGTLDYDAPRLGWSGPLGAGESVVITYTVTLGASGDGNARNVAFLGDEETPECTTDEQDKQTCAEVEYPVDLPGLIWQKVGDDTAATPLAGSEWQLIPLDANGDQLTDETIDVVDCVADDAADCADESDRDPAEGGFLVKPLNAGDYQLVETKAPAGYQLLTDPVDITISVDALNADGNYVHGEIVNRQQTVPAIPLTGGVGTFSFIVGAGVIAAAAAALLLIRARRQRVVTAEDLELL